MDFPPLPVKLEQRPDLHSRVSSLQSFSGAGVRAPTPKIPPGFESAHLQSSSTVQDTTVDKTSPVKPITAPALPAISSIPHQTATSKLRSSPSKATQQPNETLSASETVEISGKAEPNSANHDSPTLKGTQLREVDTMLPEDTHETQSESGSRDMSASLHLENVPMKPAKIEIPSATFAAVAKATADTSVASHTKSSAAHTEPVTVTTPDAMNSRPVTPGTVTSELSKSSVPRPRTLRLTTSMIQQAESARVASPAVTEKSVALPAVSQARKERSRQPSLSSISRSRPSSPSASDRLVSQDVSRAGSPPPGGIVGSASSRTKSKAQTKKERKEKAKKAESDEVGPPGSGTAPAVEEVGPIIARHKKQKKSKTFVPAEEPKQTLNVKDQGISVVRTSEAQPEQQHQDASPTKREVRVEALKHEPVPAPPERLAKASSIGSTAAPYTVHELYADASRHPNSPTAVQGLLSSHVGPMSKLLGEMIVSRQLSRDHPWLVNASFNSSMYKMPPDSRRGQDYLDANGYSSNSAFGYIYLDRKDKKELRNGASVRNSNSDDPSDDLLNSFLLTHRGWVMRHLTNDESERVQELDYRRFLYEKQLGDFGAMTGLGVLEHDDFINLGGGLNELINNGDRHGIHWILDEDEEDTGPSYDDERDALSYDQMEEDEVIVDYADDNNLDDETDEDVGPGFIGNEPTSEREPNSKSASGHTTTAGLPANVLSSSHAGGLTEMNLRLLDADALHKRVYDKHREVDNTRKEMERAEKALVRKGKEFGRWKDTLLKV